MSDTPHVLLINPWIEDFAAYDLWIQPLGLLKISSLLKEAGFKVSFIDCLDRHHPDLKNLKQSQKASDFEDGRGNYYKEIIPKPASVSFIPRRFGRYGLTIELFLEQLGNITKPDLICVTSGMSYWYRGLETVEEHVHELWPEVPLVMGGIYATLLPEHAQQRRGYDMIFPGTNLCDFVSYLKENIIGPARINLNRLRDYTNLIPDYSQLNGCHSMVIETSRGCPYSCDYCASHLFYDSYRHLNHNHLLTQIRHLKERYNTRHFTFYDDALFYNKEVHIKPLLRKFAQADLDITFHTPNGLFPKYVDDELAKLMFNTGFQTIRLSLDTIDKKRLNEMKKLKKDHLNHAFCMLEKVGYERKNLEVYILVGLPGQSSNSVIEALHYVYSLGGVSKLAEFSPVPGTEEWKRCIDSGILKKNDDPLLQNPTVFAYLNKEISIEDYKNIKKISDELNLQIRKSSKKPAR